MPPLNVGGVKLTEILPLPATTAPIVGAFGTVAGVTELESDEAAPVPTALVAVTVNVYATPFVRLVTVNGLATPLIVPPAGLDVTV